MLRRLGPVLLVRLRADAVAVGVVFLADGVAVVRVGVPLQPPTAMDVAVVTAQPEVQRAHEGRDERYVGEWAADEVVAAVRRPVDQGVQVCDRRHHGYGSSAS